jgi:hypothetical protein
MRARIDGLRLSRALVAALFVALLLPATVAAHAELVRAIPADGETVTEPVTVVSGRYSEDMADNSSLEIRDASGATVATGGVDPDDDRRMVARPDAPLTDGTYTVRSTTVSAEDGDVDRVTWTFTVAVPATASPTEAPSASTAAPSEAPSASPSPAESPSASASPSAAPSASPAPTTPTSSGGDVLLPIVVALAIVAVGAGFLLNRNRGRST